MKNTFLMSRLKIILEHQELDSDPKSIQQINLIKINFTGNLENQSTIFSIIEEAKETVLDSSQVTIKVF